MTEYTFLDSEGTVAIFETPIWRCFVNLKKESDLVPIRTGSWIVPFTDAAAADEACTKAVCEGACIRCERTNYLYIEVDGLKEIRFYLNGDDPAAHRSIIRFLVDNDLVPKTDSGQLTNLAFEFDDPETAKEFADISLSDYVDLTTAQLLN